MSDENQSWDIYYCQTPQNTPSETPNTDAPAADIPISRASRTSAEQAADYNGEIYAEGYGCDTPDTEPFFRRNHHRNLKLLIVFLLLAILIGVTIFLVVVTQKLNLIEYDSGVNFEHADQTDVQEDEDLSFTPMHDVTDASSLRDWLQKWALNGGEKLHSKNVVNCLLCGVDTQENTDGRTDAMILVSLNKRTGKITLVSFMRDCYTYMNINGEDRWYKINSAYNWGGAATLVQTIENNYKIEIDNYVTVDFDTFPKLIDALGGVEIEVEEYEAKYIRRTSSHKKFPYGDKVKLNGDQALIYSRIRKSDTDSDVSRTRRQRKMIAALIDKAKTASVGQLNNMLNLVLPYVQTNYRRSQILALATQAIMQNWMQYDIEQVACPLLTDSEDGTQVLTGKDSNILTGYARSAEFVWVVDYQLDAQRVQTALYGKTNIVIHDDQRESPFDFLSGGKTYSSYTPATTAAYGSYTTTSPYTYSYTPEPEQPDTATTTRLIERFTNLFGGDDTPEQNDTPINEPAQEEPPAFEEAF